MPEPAIVADGLGKCYQIGLAAEKFPSLRETLVRAATAPWRRLQELRGGNGHAQSRFWALRDVSFEVRPGEVLGIIGRNGAGKSTLLKILSRITEPSEGQAELNGRVASLLEVGTGFHPELTGRENIYLNGAILGMTRAEITQRFDEIVAFAEVERFLDTPVKRYSSGMYTRLAFAVAAHLEPEILIVDEVLAVGDAEFQKKCLGKMEEIATGHGRAVLFVSHNMGAIERLCTRALYLADGRTSFIGTPREAVARYTGSTVGEVVQWVRRPPFPHEPHFRRVYLCEPDGTPCRHPTSGGQFGLALEFELPEAIPDLYIAVSLFNQRYQPIFSSSPQDCGVEPPRHAGHFRTRMVFPPGVFMPGRFIAGVVLYSTTETFDREMSALTFDVAEVESLANRVPGGRIGDLQILCDWTPAETFDAAAISATGGAD